MLAGVLNRGNVCMYVLTLLGIFCFCEVGWLPFLDFGPGNTIIWLLHFSWSFGFHLPSRRAHITLLILITKNLQLSFLTPDLLDPFPSVFSTLIHFSRQKLGLFRFLQSMRSSLFVSLITCASSALFSQAQTNGSGSVDLSITPAKLISPGGTKPNIPGAPPLPTASININQYPTQDKVPPTDSKVVQEWISKIDMSKAPAIKPTGANSCSNTTYNGDAIAKAGSSDNCWWSCSGCVRPSDITTCPAKLTWGTTFDDGPSEYTTNILQYLDQNKLKATFFVVGSRAIERPDIVRAEYMLSHQVCLHTWSHPALTTLTNEQIVAEMAWSMKASKDILGVAPKCMRPPYADVDDRVRYILKAMGLQVILWTGNGESSFDTEDWRVVDGSRTASASIQKFQGILNTASSMSTGFIVLAHDLFGPTVALSLKNFLPAALRTPNMKVQSINECLGEPLAASYFETSSNAGDALNATVNPRNSTNDSHASSNTSTSVPQKQAAVPVPATKSPQSSTSSGASRATCSMGVSVLLIVLMLFLA